MNLLYLCFDNNSKCPCDENKEAPHLKWVSDYCDTVHQLTTKLRVNVRNVA